MISFSHVLLATNPYNFVGITGNEITNKSKVYNTLKIYTANFARLFGVIKTRRNKS